MLAGLRSASALVCAGLLFLAVLAVVRRRRPVALALPLAFAGVVVLQTVLLNVLSPFRGVRPGWIAGLDLCAIALCLAWARADARQPIGRFLHAELRALAWALRPRGELWLIVPLVGVLAAVAIIYPPTNWDSMTYHMARVAHWMEMRSVAYYPTSIDRQNLMGPGAEYLILALQSIGRTDRWANCVQLAAWILGVVALGPLLRLAGLPPRFARLGQVFVAVLPMSVLQATSTQNDVVASLMGLAVVIATIPFLRGRWRLADLVLLILSLCAAFLVKATALLVTGPFVLVAAVRSVLGLVRGERSWRSALVAASVGAAIVLVVLGPDFTRKLRDTGSVLGARPEIFGKADPTKARLFNSVAALCASSPWPEQTVVLTAKLGQAVLGEAPPLFSDGVFHLHEDYSGEPVQTGVMLVVIPCVLAWSLRRSARRRALALIPILGWVSFHYMVRNQPWLTRLQLPIFVLAPLAWAPLAVRPLRRVGYALLVVATAVALVYGYRAALHNETRPATMAMLHGVDRATLYYASRNWDTALHGNVVRKMAERSCPRLGLFIGADSYDYPLTWGAIQRGFHVRHYRVPSSWPCLIFSDDGLPPDPPGRRLISLGGGMWVPR